MSYFVYFKVKFYYLKLTKFESQLILINLYNLI